MLYEFIFLILHFCVVLIVDGPPPRESYSHVKAKDALETFKWRELLKDIKNMLNKPRLKIMERDYKLINSACNLSIKAALDKGDPDEAATTLIEYFEKNHDGDALLRFCEFLRDEAKEAGDAARLEDLAVKIERAVKAIRPSGIIASFVGLTTLSYYNFQKKIHTCTHAHTHTHTHMHACSHTRTHTCTHHPNHIFK